MIETIAEHQVDLSLTKEGGFVFDIGCRGFLFSDAMTDKGYCVFSVDCDSLDTDKPYYKTAITGHDGTVSVLRHNDPQATSITLGTDVVCYKLETFTDLFNIPIWEIIKFDVEGSEREIITSLTRPVAKQISMEFHLHLPGYTQSYVDDIVSKLGFLGYKTVSHEKTSQHGLPPNYWSSLFILEK